MLPQHNRKLKVHIIVGQKSINRIKITNVHRLKFNFVILLKRIKLFAIRNWKLLMIKVDLWRISLCLCQIYWWSNENSIYFRIYSQQDSGKTNSWLIFHLKCIFVKEMLTFNTFKHNSIWPIFIFHLVEYGVMHLNQLAIVQKYLFISYVSSYGYSICAHELA